MVMAVSEDASLDVVPGRLSLAHLAIIVSVAISIHLWNELSLLKAEMSVEMANLNRTQFACQDLLFFNRVPKVGSQTIMGLLVDLQELNKFKHYFDSHQIKNQFGERTYLSRALQETYVDMFMQNFSRPAAYSKHIAFIDFKSFGEHNDQPIYVNFVRNPVQRIISWYYYIRAPWYIFTTDENNSSRFTDLKDGFDNPAKYKSTFEECVLRGDPECRHISGHRAFSGEGGSHSSQMMFFCGHEPHCAITNGDQAFKSAVMNVERYFAVVGVLEEMEKSLIVLEHYVPRFFAGVSKIYKRNGKSTVKNKNIYRPKVSEDVQDMLRRNISREVLFYEFCKDRLHKQYLALGLE